MEWSTIVLADTYSYQLHGEYVSSEWEGKHSGFHWSQPLYNDHYGTWVNGINLNNWRSSGLSSLILSLIQPVGTSTLVTRQLKAQKIVQNVSNGVM